MRQPNAEQATTLTLPHRARLDVWAAYAVGLGVPLVGLLVQFLLRPITYSLPFVFFFIAVAVASWVGGMRPGMLALGVSVLLGSYDLLHSEGVFSVSSGALLATGLFCMGGALICLINGSLHARYLAREQLLTALSLERRRLEEMLAQAPALTCILRAPEYRIELVNTLYCNLFCKVAGRADLVGKPAREVLPERHAQAFPIWERVLATGEPAMGHEVATRVKGPDGREEERFFHFVFQPLRDAAGQVTGVAEFGFEVTEQVRVRRQADAANSALAAQQRWLETLQTPHGRRSVLLESAQVEGVDELPATSVVAFPDSTALESAERALRKREQEYRTLAESMPQVVWTARADGRLEYINAVFTRYIGTRAEAVGGVSWAALIHPEDTERALCRWAHSLRMGEPFEVEFRIRRADGVYRWFLARAVHMPDEEGRPLKWFGTATDIEDTKRNQEASQFLAEASALLGSTLEYEHTLQRVAALAVPALADWCMVEVLDEAGVLHPLAAVHADAARARAALERARSLPLDATAASGVAKVLRTGSLDWRENVSPAPDPETGGSGAVSSGPVSKGAADAPAGVLAELGLCSYICVPLLARGRVLGVLTLGMAESRRRFTGADVRLAADLARRAGLAVDNARLYQASQSAVRLRDEFLSIASHELKTPLTPIQLQVQALQRRLNGALDGTVRVEAVTPALGVVLAQTRKLSNLVSGLLDVSRISAGRLQLALEAVDLAALTRAVAAGFESELTRAGCPLTLQLGGPVVGRWDRLRLEQVLTNLLSNAIKYGPGEPITVSLTEDAEQAWLRVRDQGIGITPEAHSRIFGKFERAVSERHYGGLGLGLYITQQIVEAHGGLIRVESEPGSGALFEVRLPRAGLELD